MFWTTRLPETRFSANRRRSLKETNVDDEICLPLKLLSFSTSIGEIYCPSQLLENLGHWKNLWHMVHTCRTLIAKKIPHKILIQAIRRTGKVRGHVQNGIDHTPDEPLSKPAITRARARWLTSSTRLGNLRLPCPKAITHKSRMKHHETDSRQRIRWRASFFLSDSPHAGRGQPLFPGNYPEAERLACISCRGTLRLPCSWQACSKFIYLFVANQVAWLPASPGALVHDCRIHIYAHDPQRGS